MPRLRFVPFVLVALGLGAAGVPSPAPAATCTAGISGPNDPDYAPAERRVIAGGTFNVEQWYLYDCIPQSSPAASDPEGAAGMSVNRAWDSYGRGNSQVVVAYMEGGVNWRRPDAPDLRRQAYLNTGELPKPQDKDGKAAATYDLDKDGVVTVDDYKDDPRIRRPLLHADTAGGITPEDLIVAFSDGKDSDGNGYVDDISGWNFHRDTNDPQTDQSIYGHANNESRVILGEADNNFRGTGICPRCRLLSVKLGDEAIDRPDRVAEGIVFAVESGAKVIDVTSATLGQTRSMQKAVDYAYAHGVTIAWASNDFESADHTEGMRFAHVWPGNSVVGQLTNRLNQSQPGDLSNTTFRSRSSVTSYGAHALFSVASKDGSTSQATPTQAGVAALVTSAGLDAVDAKQLDRPLTANEVMQVVRATASPIAETPCAVCFPGLPDAEWNIQYGYGRPNVYEAMRAVHAGDIPPEADLRSPAWYDQVDPTRTKRVKVTARVAADRSTGYGWELQYAPGPQPADADWKTFASGTGKAAQTVSGTIDTAQIPASFWSGAYQAPTEDRLSIERYDVSVRVRVTDATNRVGLDRRVFQLRHDPSEIPALHKDLHTSLEPGATLADLEGRGRLDVVVGGADGTVFAFRPDGTRVPGWPVHTRPARGVDPGYRFNYLRAKAWRDRLVPRPREPLTAPLTVGDLDHDGGLDVVTCGADGRVYAWDRRGRLRRGFPKSTPRRYARQAVPVPDTPYVRNRSTGCVGGTALGDLEGTGRLDIVLGGWDGRVHALRPDGSPVPGWPVKTDTPQSARTPGGATIYARDYKVATTPTLVDVNGDRKLDVIVALQDTAFNEQGSPVYGFVMGWDSTGRLLPHFPLTLTAAAQGYGTAQDFITEGVQTPVSYTSADGTPKLIANAGLSVASTFDLRTGQATQETPGTLPKSGAAGNAASPLLHFSSSATVGRVGGGPLTAVQSGSAGTDVATAVVATPGLGLRVRSALSAWDPETGANRSEFVREIQGLGFLAAPVVADVTGDGKPDVLQSADSAALHGFDGTSGADAAGFPKWTGGWGVWSPAVGDLDGDGRVEVVSGLREGWLRAWRTPGRASADGESWHWHVNDRNTGHYGDDTRPPAAVRGVRVRRGLVTWRAAGDDWNAGRATAYDVRCGSVRRRVRTTRVRVAGATSCRVRAIDDAGNIGAFGGR